MQDENEMQGLGRGFFGLFYEGFFRIVHSLVSILPAQFVTGYVPNGLNDALLRLSPVELY